MNQNKLSVGEKRELRFRRLRHKIIHKQLIPGVTRKMITMNLVRHEIDPDISIQFQLYNKFVRI